MPFERGGTHEDHNNTKENAISFQSNLELRLGISSSDNSCSNNMACSKAMNSTVKGFSCSTSTSNIAPAVLYQSSSSSVLGLGGGGSYMGFPQSPLGFVHPWSLAARQQKAAIEQAHHQKSNNLASGSASASAAVASSSLSRFSEETRPMLKRGNGNFHRRSRWPLPPLAAVVGWPPVREFRRNLVSTNLPKSAMNDHEKGATSAKPAAENIDDNDDDDDNSNVMKRRTESRPTMFVKVNMEGYVVGRKINLRAHDSYESLSRAVQKMFSNFFSSE
ncbi:Auxin-responsive protein IAA27 [Ananas comosus]|uniref:Auxin-responsive protein n=1 Tax=Ananas comosus TaxID=4615 RepID=A0A199VP02_ANACO|nr:Auxin-responsive protein IAA27 [Ananas comosus]